MKLPSSLDELPIAVISHFKDIGVISLREWQDGVLSKVKHLDKNAVISAPPQAGKQVVADILAYRSVFELKIRVCIVHASPSHAKANYQFLEPIWSLSGRSLVGFFEPNSQIYTEDWDTCVATIDKMNRLLNELVKNGLFAQIGIIIIHSFHLMYDHFHSAEYECLLTKIKFWNERKSNSSPVRSICFGSIIPKSAELAQWLDAEHIFIPSNPVRTAHWLYVKEEASVFKWPNKFIRKMEHYPHDQTGGLMRLTLETIFAQGQVIIYCATKDEANRMARALITEFTKLNALKNSDFSNELNKRVEKLRELKTSFTSQHRVMCKALSKTMALGIGLYISDLLLCERDLVERGFRENKLMLLITTVQHLDLKVSAHRVLICPPLTGPAASSRHALKLMGGRGCRPNKDNFGEAYIVISRTEVRSLENIFNDADCEPKLDNINYAKLFLEAIHTHLAPDIDSLKALWQQKHFQSSVTHIDLLETLKGDLMIEEETKSLNRENPETRTATGVFTATRFGAATASLSLRTDCSLFIYYDLKRANNLIILGTQLHLVYLVTPFISNIWNCTTDWEHLQTNIYDKLTDNERKIGKIAHIKKPVLARLAKNGLSAVKEIEIHEHTRFFCSIVLCRLIDEEPIEAVAKDFKLTKAQLEDLQQRSAAYATLVVSFCHLFDWWQLSVLLKELPTRLAHGVRHELCELLHIQGIDAKRARRLYHDNLSSWGKLAWATNEKISNSLAQVFAFLQCPYNFEWLDGEPALPLGKAAHQIRQRAKQALARRLKDQGFEVEAIKLLNGAFSD